MAPLPTIYDLVLLLSTSAPEEDRNRIREEVETTITSGGGRIEHRQEWGTRPLSYEINHQGDAEYHLLQFSGPTAILESLSHNLGIADGVVRFRIIKVVPGTPPPPEGAPPLVGATTTAGVPVASGVAPASAVPAEPEA